MICSFVYLVVDDFECMDTSIGVPAAQEKRVVLRPIIEKIERAVC